MVSLTIQFHQSIKYFFADECKERTRGDHSVLLTIILYTKKTNNQQKNIWVRVCNYQKLGGHKREKIKETDYNTFEVARWAKNT